MVGKRWRLACKRDSESSNGYNVSPLLPSDSEFTTAIEERKTRLVRVSCWIEFMKLLL